VEEANHDFGEEMIIDAENDFVGLNEKIEIIWGRLFQSD
jgi:hypothetical protein